MSQIKKILIVDDDPHIRDIMGVMLQDEGYDISFAFDGKMALKKVREIHPDFIFLDIMMPEINGFSVCHEIKQDPQIQSIKIAIVSAKGFSSDRRQAKDVGADDYLTKPVTRAALLAAIKKQRL